MAGFMDAWGTIALVAGVITLAGFAYYFTKPDLAARGRAMYARRYGF